MLLTFDFIKALIFLLWLLKEIKVQEIKSQIQFILYSALIIIIFKLTNHTINSIFFFVLN